MFKAGPHEETFDITPIGVKYICEFCNEGEMVRDTSQTVLMSDPPMFQHICTKCGKTMILPKVYPYIEWVPVEEDQTDNK